MQHTIFILNLARKTLWLATKPIPMKVIRSFCLLNIVLLFLNNNCYPNNNIIADTTLLNRYLSETQRYFNVNPDSNLYYGNKALAFVHKVEISEAYFALKS